MCLFAPGSAVWKLALKIMEITHDDLYVWDFLNLFADVV